MIESQGKFHANGRDQFDSHIRKTFSFKSATLRDKRPSRRPCPPKTSEEKVAFPTPVIHPSGVKAILGAKSPRPYSLSTVSRTHSRLLGMD